LKNHDSKEQYMIYRRGTAFSIVLIFTALSLLGWFFLPLMSVSLQPSATLAVFNISSRWPNVSATNVEVRLTSKIEAALNTIEGVKSIKSVSSPGRAKVELEIDKFVKPEKIRLEISSLLRRLYPKLPQGSTYPQIRTGSSDNKEQKPLLIFSLNGPGDSFQLQEYAENNIKTKLALLQGIDKIQVYGGLGYRVNIKYDEEACRILGITSEGIRNSLSDNFMQMSLGRVVLDIADKSNLIALKLDIPVSDFTDWESIAIKKTGGRIIHLGDIAKIEKAEQSAESYFRINGKNAINIVVYPEKGSNAIALSKKVLAQINLLSIGLPSAYAINNTYNSTEYVNAELSKIYKRTFFTLLILLAFVFIVSLSYKYVLLIVLSLFTNISISFILYYLLGIEIHLYSLAGITVSLGLIIDNSIVMADHLIYRKNLKVYTALLASTLTTIVSLVIVWFLPGNLKLKLWDFALIIVVNLFVSLVVSLFYIPALLSRMKLDKKKSASAFRIKRIKVWLNVRYFVFINFMIRYRTWALLLLLLAFGLPVFLLPNKIDRQGFWPDIYNNTLGSDWYVDNLKPSVNKYLGGSLRLFSYYVFENSYYAEAEETKLSVVAALPKGATVEQLNAVIIELEKFIGQFSDKINYLSRINGAQFAEIQISFKNNNPSDPFPYILKNRIVAQTIDMGGVNWDVYGIGKGFSNRLGINEMVNFKVALKGYNYDELERQAIKLKAKLEKHPRVKKVNIAAGRNWWAKEKSYEYFIRMKTDKMEGRSIANSDVYHEIAKNSVFDNGQGWLFTGSSYELINIVPDKKIQPDKWEVMNRPMTSSGFKLAQFIDIEKQTEQQSIYKENQNYIRTVDFQYIGSSKFGREFLEKVLKEMDAEFPIGYSAKSMQGYYGLKEQSVPYTFLILLIGLIIFVLCSILFESLKRPIAIILMVPASFIGVFMSFYFFDFNFDQGGYASFVLISGLVVNSAIYILNDFDLLSGKKKEKVNTRIYVKAFNRKIVPVLLTIGSTVLGLLPFVIGGQNEPFWFALAAGTMGGLIFSIFIIVVYLPIFVLRKNSMLTASFSRTEKT
jgi:multidrug efflux pump subunit AcrB